MRKIFFITDMDGTLLPKNKQINPADKNSADLLINSGGMFSVATGRSLPSAAQYFGKISINAPIILFNGGLVYDLENNKPLMTSYLPDSALDIIKDAFKSFAEIGCEIDTIDHVYVPQTNDEEDYHIEISYKNNEFSRTSLNDVPMGDWLKILFADSPQKIEQFMEYIHKKGYNDVNFVTSSKTYFEMLPKGVNKGSALKWIIDEYHLYDFTVVACGDFDNDIEMLEAADIAIAPANAIDSVKDAADYIAKASCNDGFVAEAVEYVLNRC